MKELLAQAAVPEPAEGWENADLRAAHSSFEFLDSVLPGSETPDGPLTRLVAFGSELIEFNVNRVRDFDGQDLGMLLVGERMTDKIKQDVADRTKHDPGARKRTDRGVKGHDLPHR